MHPDTKIKSSITQIRLKRDTNYDIDTIPTTRYNIACGTVFFTVPMLHTPQKNTRVDVSIAAQRYSGTKNKSC